MLAPDFAAHRGAGREERVVRGRGSVLVQPQNDAGQMGVVRRRAAEVSSTKGGVRNGPFGRFCSQPRRPWSPMNR